MQKCPVGNRNRLSRRSSNWTFASFHTCFVRRVLMWPHTQQIPQLLNSTRVGNWLENGLTARKQTRHKELQWLWVDIQGLPTQRSQPRSVLQNNLLKFVKFLWTVCSVCCSEKTPRTNQNAQAHTQERETRSRKCATAKPYCRQRWVNSLHPENTPLTRGHRRQLQPWD